MDMLQIARLHCSPVVRFCSAGSILEELFDFLVERLVEVG
jgi:hypothetical protein